MRATPPIRVVFVLLANSLALDWAGPAEALRIANQRLRTAGRPEHFAIEFASPRPTSVTSVGVLLTGLSPLPTTWTGPAWVVMVGLPGNTIPVDSDETRELLHWLRSLRFVSGRLELMTICAGLQQRGRDHRHRSDAPPHCRNLRRTAGGAGSADDGCGIASRSARSGAVAVSRLPQSPARGIASRAGRCERAAAGRLERAEDGRCRAHFGPPPDTSFRRTCRRCTAGVPEASSARHRAAGTRLGRQCHTGGSAFGLRLGHTAEARLVSVRFAGFAVGRQSRLIDRTDTDLRLSQPLVRKSPQRVDL